MPNLLANLISNFFKVLIRIYQIAVSPVITFIFGTRCRFYPSCSRYAIQCLETKPLSSAIFSISGRLCKCGPWHPGGVDLP